MIENCATCGKTLRLSKSAMSLLEKLNSTRPATCAGCAVDAKGSLSSEGPG